MVSPWPMGLRQKDATRLQPSKKENSCITEFRPRNLAMINVKGSAMDRRSARYKFPRYQGGLTVKRTLDLSQRGTNSRNFVNSAKIAARGSK